MVFNSPIDPRLPRGGERICASVSSKLFDALIQRSTREGRSLSNLCAFLLERAMEQESDS
jgi:hypothetical protein